MSRHGLSSYTHGCRCGICRAAMATYRRSHRANVRGKVPPEVPHGLASTAQNYGCRCQACRDANAARQREWYRRVVLKEGGA
jgi:hypothetical protein